MTSTTDFSKNQLATILSALDDAPRSPANKGEAAARDRPQRPAVGPHHRRCPAAAPGLLDGRMSPADFRAELQDPDEPRRSRSPTRPQAALARRTRHHGQEAQPRAAAANRAGTGRRGARRGRQAEPPKATARPSRRKRKAKAKAAKPAKAAPAEKPTPRAGTKQAQ